MIIGILDEIEDTGGPLGPFDSAENCTGFAKRKRIRDKLSKWVGPYHARMADIHVLAATLGEDVTGFNEDFYVATPT